MLLTVRASIPLNVTEPPAESVAATSLPELLNAKSFKLLIPE